MKAKNNIGVLQDGWFAKQSGLFLRLKEYSNVGSESGKRKTTALSSFGICDIRSIWLQVPSFPRARPRMCRREDWVAALNLIEAHSHTLSRFRRNKSSKGGCLVGPVPYSCSPTEMSGMQRLHLNRIVSTTVGAQIVCEP